MCIHVFKSKAAYSIGVRWSRDTGLVNKLSPNTSGAFWSGYLVQFREKGKEGVNHNNNVCPLDLSWSLNVICCNWPDTCLTTSRRHLIVWQEGAPHWTEWNVDMDTRLLCAVLILVSVSMPAANNSSMYCVDNDTLMYADKLTEIYGADGWIGEAGLVRMIRDFQTSDSVNSLLSPCPDNNTHCTQWKNKVSTSWRFSYSCRIKWVAQRSYLHQAY